MYVLWLYVLFMHLCLFYYIRHVCPLNIHYPCMSDCSNTTGMSVLWISMHVWLLQYSRHACPLNIHACLSFVLQQTCLTDMVCPLNILYMHLWHVWQTWSVLWIYYSCMHVLWISMHANYRLNMFDQYIYIIRNCAKFYHLKLVIHLLWLRLV